LINPPADQLGRANAILGGTAAGCFDLRPAGCLIVNDGEQYTISVEAPQPVETTVPSDA
jgi:hypothetical protein